MKEKNTTALVFELVVVLAILTIIARNADLWM